MNAPCRWAVQWRSGDSNYVLWDNRMPLLFHTRKDARTWAEKNYGYIKERQDLRNDPHRWRMPKAVMVRVILELRVAALK